MEAGDGPEALSILERTPGVELLFTDMVMPGGMSGADLAAASSKRFPEIPVLFTSGYAAPEITAQAGARVSSWLRKPYTVTDLAAALRRVFSEEERTPVNSCRQGRGVLRYRGKLGGRAALMVECIVRRRRAMTPAL